MKKLKNKIFGLFCLLVIVAGCNKDTLDLYSNEDSGSSLFFLNPYNTAFSNAYQLDTSFVYSFGYMPEYFKQINMEIPVKATGVASDVDREFKFVIDPASNLKQNVHYVIKNERFIIPAGKNDTTISITILRTADMQTEPLVAYFRLQENENFNVKLNYRTNNNRTQYINLLEYSLVVDDIIGPPYAWTVTPYKTNFDNYLGPYSKAKLQLIVDLFDIDPEVFIDENYAKTNYFSVAMMSYWANYTKYWLGKEAGEGRIYYDEHGEVIKMGPRAM